MEIDILSNRQKRQLTNKSKFYCFKCDCNKIGQTGKCSYCGYKDYKNNRKRRLK